MSRRWLRPSEDRREGGQSLVEFSLALIPFVLLIMAVVDLGRGIYTNNQTAQAAREIARVAIVHPCSGPCSSATWSTEIAEVVGAQKAMLPGLTNAGIVIDCVTISDVAVTVGTNGSCPPGEFVRVRVTVAFGLVSPFVPVNPWTASSTSHIQVP